MTNTGCYKFVKIIWIIVHILGAIASLVPWSQKLEKPSKKIKSFEFFKWRRGGSALTKITEMQ